MGATGTSMIKGKGLFASNYWGVMNLKAPSDSELQSTPTSQKNLAEQKLQRFSSVLKWKREIFLKVLETAQIVEHGPNEDHI